MPNNNLGLDRQNQQHQIQQQTFTQPPLPSQHGYPPNQPFQSINPNNASNNNNYLSQTMTNPAQNSRINQNIDTFSSFQQNIGLNTKIPNNPPSQQSIMISSHNIDLSVYPGPHPISPTGKYLTKLLPPNDQTYKFFTELFN